MKFLALFAVLCIAVHSARAAPADNVDCSKMEETLDEMGGAQGFSTMNEKYKLATTVDEFNKRCSEMNDAIKTLRKYNNKCYTSLTQQVFSAILRTRSQMQDVRCKADTPEAAEALAASKCIQENAFNAVKEAEKKAILLSQVLHDSNVADEKLRTRRACCGVQASRQLFMDATKEKCAKHEKLYAEYMDSYTSEAMGLICADADKLECDKLEPLKTEGVELKSKFFLVPVLKLVKTLDH